MLKSKTMDLSKNRILAGLPMKESRRLLPHLEFVPLARQEVLQRPGETLRYAYFPEDAIVSLMTAMQDGSTVEVGVIGCEGILGIQAFLGTRTLSNVAVVQVAGGSLRIKAEVLRSEFKRGGVLADRLLVYTYYLLVHLAQTAACNRVHLLEQRLCRWLLLVSDRAQKDEFLVTHESLANVLGTTRAEVSLAAAVLRSHKFIQYGRGKMTIMDKRGLESVACECYRIVADDIDHLLKGKEC
jgi:CRP-like cAMP-binding protein